MRNSKRLDAIDLALRPDAKVDHHAMVKWLADHLSRSERDQLREMIRPSLGGSDWARCTDHVRDFLEARGYPSERERNLIKVQLVGLS
jgi:hypothetical protein